MAGSGSLTPPAADTVGEPNATDRRRARAAPPSRGRGEPPPPRGRARKSPHLLPLFPRPRRSPRGGQLRGRTPGLPPPGGGGGAARAAGGVAVVLQRLADPEPRSTRGGGTRLTVGPPARAHRPVDEPDASPRRRSCRPSFAVRAPPRAPRASARCIPLQPVQTPCEARERRQVLVAGELVGASVRRAHPPSFGQIDNPTPLVGGRGAPPPIDRVRLWESAVPLGLRTGRGGTPRRAPPRAERGGGGPSAPSRRPRASTRPNLLPPPRLRRPRRPGGSRQLPARPAHGRRPRRLEARPAGPTWSTPCRTCRPAGWVLRVLAGQGARRADTTTAAGRLVFGIFAALAEFRSANARWPGSRPRAPADARAARRESAGQATEPLPATRLPLDSTRMLSVPWSSAGPALLFALGLIGCYSVRLGVGCDPGGGAAAAGPFL